MTDKKISALSAATLPLGGTEVLPLVQSGTTDNITVNNLAAGNLKSQSTTGVLQVSGPATGSVRVVTVPNSNWTAARTDNSQTFLDTNTFSSVTTVRNAVTRPSVIDGGTAVPNPYENFGIGAKYTGYDYGNALRDYAYVDAVMTAKNSSAGGGDAGFKTALDFSTNMGGSSGAVPTVQFRIDELGNLVPLNAAKGINFTANTPAAGMTSQLLNWYEEGTWTPVVRGDGTAGTYETVILYGFYTRKGREVTLYAGITLAGAVTGGGTGSLIISGNPFTKSASTPTFAGSVIGAMATTIPMTVTFSTRGAASNIYVFNTLGAAIQVSEATANKYLDFNLTFFV